MFLGQRIRQDERKISQKEMAEKMQLYRIPITRETYVKLERGIRNVGASELKAIKEILDTTYEALLEESQEQREEEQ